MPKSKGRPINRRPKYRAGFQFEGQYVTTFPFKSNPKGSYEVLPKLTLCMRQAVPVLLFFLILASSLDAKSQGDHHKSHKKMWATVAVTVAAGVAVGTMAHRSGTSQGPALNRITCGICSTVGR